MKVSGLIQNTILRFHMSYSDADNHLPYIGQRSSDLFAETLKIKKELEWLL